MERVTVTVPQGATEGTTLQVQSSSGQTVAVQVPPGAKPGSQFSVDVPAAAVVSPEAVGLLPAATGGAVLPAVDSKPPPPAEAPTSAQLSLKVTLKPWTEAGQLDVNFVGERTESDSEEEDEPKCCDEEHDLKNITVDVANQNEKEAIARVVGMVATHDFDMQSKYERQEVQEIDVNGILRPEEKVLAQLPAVMIEGFPQDHADYDEDVKGKCMLTLIEVADAVDANPLNKGNPKGPQTLVFTYTGEVDRTLRGSGYEVCKGGMCCVKEYHEFEMSREQKSGMGTVQVQPQLVSISCQESNAMTIYKEGIPFKKKCCTRKCLFNCLAACCNLCCVCCQCCKQPTMKYDVHIDDAEVELEELLGEEHEFKGKIARQGEKDFKWTVKEKSLQFNQITLKWLDPVTDEIKTTTVTIDPQAPRQEIARFVKMADYTKGWSLPAGKKQSSGKASGGVLGRFGGGGGGSGAKASKSKGGSTKYCGILSHVIGLFFPCICFCPVDDLESGQEAYLGPMSLLCCILLGHWPVLCCPIDTRRKGGGKSKGMSVQVMER